MASRGEWHARYDYHHEDDEQALANDPAYGRKGVDNAAKSKRKTGSIETRRSGASLFPHGVAMVVGNV